MATETGSQGSAYDGRLFEWYTKYVSEPESKKDVYGYTLLLVGYVLAMGGMLLFQIGGFLVDSLGMAETAAFTVRGYTGMGAGIGVILALLGITLLMPITRSSIIAAVVGSLVSLVAIALVWPFYPYNWDTGEPSYGTMVVGIYSIGVAITVGVVILVPIITGERSYFADTAHGPQQDHPEIMIGEADRGGLFAVFKQGTEWTWRFIDQSAVAGSTRNFLSQLEAEERVDAVKQQVASAGLLEIKNAAFRLYESAEGSWQWYLMREDGTAVAEGGREYETRDQADSAINTIKDHGPTAETFVMDEAVYDTYKKNGGWGWRLVDQNRTPLAVSADSFSSRADAAAAGHERFRELAGDAVDLVIETYGIELVEEDGRWHWRLRDSAHRQLANSVDEYGSKGTVEDEVYDLLDRFQRASILDAGTPTYDVYQTGSAWSWRLVDANGRTVGEAAETAGDPDEATQQAERMRADAGTADVVQIEDLDFETYRDGDGWHWRLIDPDRNVRARSTDSYESEEEASRIVDRVREEAPHAELIEFQNAAFQVYEAPGGAWRWRLIDEDGNVMADSGQGEYESKDDAMSAMMTLQENAPDAEHLEIENAAFELFQDDDGWGWRLVDDIGETIADGATRHDTEDGARQAMDDLIDSVSDVDERLMDAGIFQVYADADDEWWWRFVLPDGTIVADGTQSFGTRHKVEDAVERLQDYAGDAPVETIGRLAVMLDPEDWSWEIVDADREAIAVSTVSHDSRAEVTEQVESIQRDATEITVYEIGKAAYDCYQDDGGWSWRLIDADHDDIAHSPEPAEELAGVEEAIDVVSAVAPDAEFVDYDDVAFELFPEGDGWTWQLVDEDQSTLAVAASEYDTREEAERDVDNARTEIADASVIEIDSASFEFHHTDEGWRWRLVDANGNELGESIATFDSRAEAQEELTTVKELGPEAWVSVAE